MIQVLKNMEDCYGCRACYQVCPTNSITMQEQDLFHYPVIDQATCIDCNLCAKTCPVNQSNLLHPEVTTCLASANANQSHKKKSSSGGIFYLLATQILNRGGFVCGAAFSSDWQLKHVIIDDISKLQPLMKSKYVASDCDDAYIQIAALLKKQKEVFYVGTSCQVAGLKSYLQTKRVDAARLLTADILCHGTPSHRVFDDYLKETLPADAKITGIDFRNKKFSWREYEFSVQYINRGESLSYNRLSRDDVFMQGFLKDLYLRKSCYRCMFTKLSRTGDITLGDFWGIEQVCASIDNDTGVSLILLNSEKGKTAFKSIQPQLEYVEELDSKSAAKYNTVLNGPVKAHQNVDRFVSNYQSLPVRKNITDCLGISDKLKKVGVMNFHYCNFNFGAVLVPYAVSEVLKQLGYEAEVIDHVPAWYIEAREHEDSSKVTNFELFRKQFLKITPRCIGDDEFAAMNESFDKLLVGSDQIWAAPFAFKYLLDWASGKKTFISYAASFGQDRFVHYTEDDKSIANLMLARFDAVSVREDTGVELCKQLGRRDAQLVIDPTLLLDPSGYQKIIDADADKSYLPDKPYVAYMFLDASVEASFFEKNFAKDSCCINILKDDEDCFRTVGAWINLIKNCDFFVTDSFHGVVFALLHHQEFLCYKRDIGGNTRLENLLRTFNLSPERFFQSWDEFDALLSLNPIDFQDFEEILKRERKSSLAFLTKALEMEPIYKAPVLTPQEKLAIQQLTEAKEKLRCQDEQLRQEEQRRHEAQLQQSLGVYYKYKFFKKGLSLFKYKTLDNCTRVRLLNFIPLLKIYARAGKKTYKLFHLIPLIKLRQKAHRQKVYLFGFIYIGEWQKTNFHPPSKNG